MGVDRSKWRVRHRLIRRRPEIQAWRVRLSVEPTGLFYIYTGLDFIDMRAVADYQLSLRSRRNLAAFLVLRVSGKECGR